jgi:hypothetical protein
MLSIPMIFTGGLQSTNAGQTFSISISGVTVNGFTYLKTFIAFSGTTITGTGSATGEEFSWMAISV